MTQITEEKLIYPDFKYFKSIYTQINMGNIIYLTGKNDYVELVYQRDSTFYILTGKLFGNIELFNWLKRTKNTIKTEIDKIVELGKEVLKKNVISIEYDDNTFIYNYSLKDGTTVRREFSSCQPPEMKTIIYQKYFSLDSSFISEDICEIFIDKNSNITNERTSDKLIEIPTNRILSLVKDGTNSVFFTEKNQAGQRYVSIKSRNENLGVELCQEFLTI